MTKKLQASKEWYNWFCNEIIELVTTIDNRESFIESIQVEFKGNQVNYQTIFKLLDTFKKTFDFLLIKKIRLIWCDELEDLQFYDVEQDYEFWKESVIKKGLKIDWLSNIEFEDSTDVYFNYALNVEGEKKSLYQYKQFDSTLIRLWYNSKTDTTHYYLEIELRKSLFKLDDKFEINLSDSYTEQNMKVLETSKHEFLNELESLI